MEVLVCPQCGGNDLIPFGSFAYKCEACGTILKEDEDEKPAPPKTHFVAPISSFDYDEENNLSSRIDGSNMDNPDTHATKIIFGVVLAVLVIIGLVCVNLPSSPPQQQIVSDFDPMAELTEKLQLQLDSMDNQIIDLPSYEASTYEEKGITIKQADLISDDVITKGWNLESNQHLIISLKKPKGFTREEKKVFIGIGITVKDERSRVKYSTDDLNKTEGDKGENYLRYKEKCDISLIISDSFGFTGKGNYVIEYRVWDKKSSKEITGKIPVFVTK